MVWATSRMTRISIALSVVAMLCVATTASAEKKKQKVTANELRLTIEEAIEASRMTGASILAVAGDAS